VVRLLLFHCPFLLSLWAYLHANAQAADRAVFGKEVVASLCLSSDALNCIQVIPMFYTSKSPRATEQQRHRLTTGEFRAIGVI
jgi:hypothetical protein